MQGTLISNLYQYIRENNPEVLLALEETGSITKYLSEKVTGVDIVIEELTKQDKPGSIVEEVCMNFLTKDLKPSRYNYICGVLESEFELQYNQLMESGLLLYEISNMIQHCRTVFDELNFSEENKDNRFLRYAITGSVYEYVKSRG